MSNMMLDVDQAGEVKAALRRGDWTNGELKQACECDLFTQARQVLLGKARIVPITEHTVQEVKEKVKRVLTPFLTITTGPATKESLVADIQANKDENGVADKVFGYAKIMINNPKFTISPEKEDVSFVALALGADIGFTDNPKTIDHMTDKFCQKWSAENLEGQVIELCRPDDGLRIRKHWTHQPKNTVVWCAMQRLINPGRGPCIWELERNSCGNRWLNGRWMGPASNWNLAARVVFRLSKTQNFVA